MKEFSLQIVTPNGLKFDSTAQSLSLRTITGDVGIMAGHTDYVAPLGMGPAKITAGGQTRIGACIGGMLSVSKEKVTVVASTFEWKEEIDIPRAEAAADKARKILEHSAGCTQEELAMAQAKLKRAKVRLGVAKSNRTP